MGRYFIKRALAAIPLLFLISIIVFFGLRLSGADPIAYLANDPKVSEKDRAMLRASLGLDDPIPLQYVEWLFGDNWLKRDTTGDGIPDEYGKRLGILRGDLGESAQKHRPVAQVIGEALPNTLLLGLTAYAVTVVAALAIGIYAALHQYSWADNLITTGSFITFSMPIFFIALLSVQVFAVQAKRLGLPYLPVQGMYDVRGNRTLDDLVRHMVLPVLSIAGISIAGYSRYIRATMLEVIHSDYVRTARSKGLSERRVNYLHAIKNASLPVVTLIGLELPFVLAGAVVTETIFSWPGMGHLFITSLEPIDPPVIMVFVLLVAVAVVFSQLLTDMLYAWLDPRIRYT
jgi:peptide/nickel transport system permease protein